MRHVYTIMLAALLGGIAAQAQETLMITIKFTMLLSEWLGELFFLMVDILG